MIQPLLARARTCVQHDRIDEAIGLLREAAKLAPAEAAVHHDVGYLCLRSGRFGEAAGAFQAAILADPGFALAHVRLGVALQALGDPDGALAAYGRAGEIDGSRADAPFRAGVLLEALGRRVPALAALRRAASTRPPSALSRLAEARLALDAGRHDAAEQVLRALLAAHPGHLEATDTLGSVLADAGRAEAAFACYEHVTRTSHQYAGSFYDLVRCRRIGTTDAALVDRMAAAAARPGLHAEARVKLHLALGKVADDLGDPGEAMRQFDIAGGIRGERDDEDGRAVEARVERLIGRFGAQRLARAAERGHPDGRAILIVGLPRSGTTLVEQILSCHPEVHPGGELPFWTERASPAGEEDAEQRGRLATGYVELLHGLAPAAGRVTDKMPLNVFQVGLVHSCLPRAMIVSCRRRPIDVALSIRRTHFNRGVGIPTGGAALVAAIRAVERLSSHWRRVVPAAQFHEVSHERLVSEPCREIGALLSACGLAWNDACLHPERNARVVRTPSRWQVRQPITAPPPDAWRRYEPWLGALSALT